MGAKLDLQIQTARQRFLETGSNEDALVLVRGYIRKRNPQAWLEMKIDDILKG